MKTLEIIAHNLEDIKAINQSCATRIELCIDMEQDGLTPTRELITQSLALTTIPIMVMIRNHSRNFVYNKIEFSVMLAQISNYRKLGIKGIVIGCLKANNNEIDFEQMRAIKLATQNIEITFHRAFDLVEDKINSAKKLAKIGINRIMTIGTPGHPITDNIEILQRLSEEIEVLAGGGINQSNIKTLSTAGLAHFHVGTAVRESKSWNGAIDFKKIDQLWIA